MRYLPHVLLRAAYFAVVAFGTAEPAERWSYDKTAYSPTGGSNSDPVTGAVPNEVSGRAAFGFALTSGMTLVAEAIVARDGRRS